MEDMICFAKYDQLGSEFVLVLFGFHLCEWRINVSHECECGCFVEIGNYFWEHNFMHGPFTVFQAIHCLDEDV